MDGGWVGDYLAIELVMIRNIFIVNLSKIST